MVAAVSHIPAPMTDEQRAQIIQVDLENPPAFIKVIADKADLVGLRRLPPSMTTFMIKPDWSHPDLFGRGTVSLPEREHEVFQLYAHKGDGFTIKGRGFRRACDFMCRPAAPSAQISKLEKNRTLLATKKLFGEFWQLALDIQHHLQFDQVYASLYVERCNRLSGGGANTGIHADSELRLFGATEHGNVLLPDPTILREKRKTQKIRLITDAIDAGVPVYQGPLQTITGLYGTDGNKGFASDHAVFEMPDGTTCGRSSLRASFYNKPYIR